MNKIPCSSQNIVAKTLPADVCTFGGYGRLSSAVVHSADYQFVSWVKLRIHFSSIVSYLRNHSFLLGWNSCKQHSELSTRYCFWSTLSKLGTHFEHSFLIDKYSWKLLLLYLLISTTSLVSHVTSIYNRPKQVCGVFWCFPG